MANNLKVFDTIQEYERATIPSNAVSYIKEDNSIRYSGGIETSMQAPITGIKVNGDVVNIDSDGKIDIGSVQETLVSGSNIKTINGFSVLGYGNIDISTNGTIDLSGYVTKEELSSVATSGDYNDLSNKPDNVVESTVSGWGFTKNPGTITSVSANGTTIASNGAANIPAATTSKYGVTKLSSSTNSTSTTLAATASAVKSAYDLASSKQDVISDLDEIRNKANLGATAIQSVKTINGSSIVGTGDLVIEGGSNIYVFNPNGNPAEEYEGLQDAVNNGKTVVVWIEDGGTSPVVCTVLYYYYGTDSFLVTYKLDIADLEKGGNISYESMNVSRTAIEPIGSFAAPIISSLKTINGKSILGDGDLSIQSANIVTLDIGSLPTQNSSVTVDLTEEQLQILRLEDAVIKLTFNNLGKSHVCTMFHTINQLTHVYSGIAYEVKNSVDYDTNKRYVYGQFKHASNTSNPITFTISDIILTGSDVKTINGQSIVGSGDITISGGSIDTSNFATKDELAQKQDVISDIDTIRTNAANYKGTVTSVKVDNVSKSPSSGAVDLGYVNKKLTTSTSSSMSLSPNVYYRNTSTSLSTLTITLGSVSNSNIINEYFVEFTTRSAGTTVSLPSTIKWANGETPTFEASTTYQISIVNNLGVVTKFK
jgi:hypothetical protein